VDRLAETALQCVYDAAGHSAVIHSSFDADIRQQVRFDPIPLFLAQLKQIPAHDPIVTA
jgi:hypothetical protein